MLKNKMGSPTSRSHRRSRLLSRMLVAAERPADESYQVDLAKGRIEYKIKGTTTTWGDALLLGTFSSVDGTWLWGFNNPSVTPKNPLPLRELYGSDPHWHGEAIQAALAGSDFSLHDFCDYLSEQLGFLAAFPAELEKSTAWLAVNPSLKPDWPADHPDNLWCDTCGVPAWNAKKLIRGALGGVCDSCIQSALDCMSETQTDLDSEFAPTFPPCILSGQCTPRVMTTYSAIGYAAARQVADICQDKK